MTSDGRTAICILAMTAALLLAGCLSHEQIGAVAQRSRPAGYAVAIAYARTTERDCPRTDFAIGKWSENIYLSEYRLMHISVMNNTHIAQGTLPPGTYEIVSVSCDLLWNAADGKYKTEIFSASPVELHGLLLIHGYKKGIARFTVGADEVVNLGGFEIEKVGSDSAIFHPVPMPPGSLAEWKRLHPEWAPKLVDRQAVPRS